jgi:hypothetical protein
LDGVFVRLSYILSQEHFTNIAYQQHRHSPEGGGVVRRVAELSNNTATLRVVAVLSGGAAFAQD